MNRLFLSIIAGAISATAIGVPAAIAQSGTRDDQAFAREQVDAGKVLPLRDIEKRVLPQMKGMQYLGPSYDSVAKAYRLRFMKNGKVVFVDVDARSGRVLSRSE